MQHTKDWASTRSVADGTKTADLLLGEPEGADAHETIYRSPFIQARGALKKELLEHLRRTRAMRRSRHHTLKTDDHGRIRDTVSISERPATVEDRAIPGHWEGDLLCGSGSSRLRPSSNVRRAT
jgi:IS30 family transposase